MKLRARRVLKITILGAFVVYGIVDLTPQVLTRVLHALLGMRTPVASAYYTVRISNSTSTELIASVYILNDLAFEVDNWWVGRQKQRSGWMDHKAVALTVGSSAEIVLPSLVEPRIGSILVLARTRIRAPGGSKPEQSVAAILASWKQGSPIEIPIRDTDLQALGIDRPAFEVRRQ